MHNSRFRLMTGLAGATLCLFAVTANGQNTNTPTSAPTGAAGSVSTQTTPGDATVQPGTATTPSTVTTDGSVTRSTATDVATTTTTTRGFPGGLLGIFAVVVLVLLVLFALFRGRDRTVVRETYTSSNTTRNVGTAADDRMNLNPRAASGTGTDSGGMNDPNARS